MLLLAIVVFLTPGEGKNCFGVGFTRVVPTYFNRQLVEHFAS